MKTAPLLLFLALFSCERGGDYIDLYVYKTKADYSSKVSVKLSVDKSRITAAPGPQDVDTTKNWPMILADGYFLNGIFGSYNTGFLTIEKKDYYSWPKFPGSDSLYKLILDKEPFTMFYYFSDKSGILRNENGSIDTAKINQLITDGDLEEYFTCILK
jgi:hypothetical protein